MKNIYLNTQAYDKNITSSNLIANQNIIINENKNWNVNSSKKIDFNSIYINMKNSLYKLKCDNFDFPVNNNIKCCLENKIIEYLPIFIIEFAKLKYLLIVIISYKVNIKLNFH